MTVQRIPMLPVYERPSHPGRGDPLGDFGATDNVTLLRSGRLAQLQALRRVPARHNAILVPAYHCLSMIEPVIAHGARPIFYRLNPALAPDLNHIEQHIAEVDAVVAVHFFGVPQDLRALRQLCSDHDVALIEDCAHTLFGDVGQTGDFAIASLRKFYPLFDGGAVRSNTEHRVNTGRRSWRYELKAYKNTLETAASYGRIGRGRARAGTEPVQETPPHPVPLPQGRPVGYVDPRYDPDLSSAPMSLMARHQLKTVDAPAVKARRRELAQRLDGACRELTRIRPFLDDPARASVPYVFLLQLDRPDQDFPRLKRLGLPIWRWDALATDVCPVSAQLRTSLLQIPCHQGLKDEEVQQMCTWLQDVDAS